MALPVCHKGNEALRLAQGIADDFHNVDVSHLIVAADVVDLAHTALVEDQVDSLAVVLHIQPVPDIQTFPVDRQGLVIQCIGNHQWNQLLREMVGAIVVGAAGDSHRQAIGPMIRQHQQIGGSLGGRIGRAGVDGGLLCEEQIRPIQGQVAVDLVGGDLVIAGDAVFPAGIHQHLGAQNIGLQKHLGVFDGAVNMAFCSEVYHHIRMLFFK